MPLDQLLGALEREAQATADRLLADAREEVARIDAAAEGELARRRELSVRPRVAELRAAMEQGVAEATRKARAEVLSARERLLTRVLAGVRSALPRATSLAAYRAALPARVGAALGCVSRDQAVVLRCAASLTGALREASSARSGVVVQTDESVGSGFRLVARDAALEIDDTLESRLDRNTMALAREALRQLGCAP